MSNQELIKVAEHLEQRIDGATSAMRLALQPEFTRTLDRMRDAGVKIPLRLKRLDEILCEEAVEDSFDNMPV
ncbi:hypothetical protein QEZ52_07635 [Aliisedimentitalea scapharcae]|uniref:Uncharacterized protein n=1 Tax=Aliisedimentitalea scapharcae TaxID=1524259 RepID=A0ABZ2XXL0_9RHOB|nr:hypothetical protein K3727_07545 [Rhodobacteraceae bacterium M382]